MKISVIENNCKMYYQLSDLTPEYEKVLKGNHYCRVGNGFEKCFKLPFANKEKTKANFLSCAEEMFTDIANSKPMRWEEGLKHFASIAKEAGIDWWTSGRAALALMGVDITVDDLDFIFYTPDIALVNEAFKEYIIEPIVSTEGTPRSGTVKYYGVAYSYCRTCFIFEPFASVDDPEPTHFGQYAIKNLETINWNGYSIKVAPLDLHFKTYERWGSKQTVQKIQEFLHKNSRA